MDLKGADHVLTQRYGQARIYGKYRVLLQAKPVPSHSHVSWR